MLLSWAVPKGPSLDPRQRRLAVHVEDHPVEYGEFEGIIPSGYGAGTVMVWDMGEMVWTGPTEDVQFGLDKGHVDFELRGERLRGEFTLIRTQPSDGRSQEQWLLMKKKDEAATSPPAPLHDTSVLTGRTLDEIAHDLPARELREENQRGAAAVGTPLDTPPPLRLSPMLATLTDQPFSHPDWIFELKYDGERVLARIEANRARLASRTGRDETERYPELIPDLQRLPCASALIDGEVVALDSRGAPSFERLQTRMQLRPAEAARAQEQVPVTYFAFDLLFLDGHDLRQLPLRQRKQALRRLLRPDGGRLHYADAVEELGEAFYEQVRQQGLEGMMAKRSDSAYATGRRSRDWLKIKVRPTQDCVICGYTAGTGRRSRLGALLLGVYQAGRLTDAGRVGTGFDERTLSDLRQRLEPLGTKAPPIQLQEASRQPVTWVQPSLVCEVEHAGWTTGGRLRQPSFRTLREDVPPEACVREPPAQSRAITASQQAAGRRRLGPRPEAGAANEQELLDRLARLPARGGTLEVDGRELPLTNLDKILWPEAGVTKRELISYHLQLAAFLLPHLRDRAIVLRMMPDGVDGKSFWRRQLPASAPEWIPRWRAEPGTPTLCPLIQERAALAWLANAGALEVHPWHSRRDLPTQPDWAVFDLDPGPGATFDQVVQVARLIKVGLDHQRLRCYLKTTGQEGLHIYVPIRRGPSQEQVRDWVGDFASQVLAAAPDLVTDVWEVKRRQGRVRIDYTQNVVGKTLAAVYSPRPSPLAAVSTPIDWDELDQLRPDRFNIKTVPARVAERGDLFAGALTGEQRLPADAATIPASSRRGRKH